MSLFDNTKVVAKARYVSRCKRAYVRPSRSFGGILELETEHSSFVRLTSDKFKELARPLRPWDERWDEDFNQEDAERFIKWITGKQVKLRRVRREAPYEPDPTQTIVMFDDYLMEVL